MTNKENQRSDDEVRESFSKALLVPNVDASQAIMRLNKNCALGDSGVIGLDGATLSKYLKDENKKLRNGDLSRVEEMLLGQAHTLQMMSTNLIGHAMARDTFELFEGYTRLALKAQNQCRQTLATLAEMKNPRRTQFIKQQNNAVNQQINQGEGCDIPAGEAPENPKNSEKAANKLLKEETHERLDIGAKKATVGVDSKLEAMGEINRSKN